MDEPIEEIYFKWLYSKVASVDNPTPSLTYWTLLRDLHATEFVWLLSGDDNRAEDGLDIRKEFIKEIEVAFRNEPLYLDPSWTNLGCSVLEMLIAFSRRASFETQLQSREWFWIFLNNLGLSGFSDAVSNTSQRTAEILERFIWRTYSRNGKGGLFPLSKTRSDQSKIQIWYQFFDYLEDQEIV